MTAEAASGQWTAEQRAALLARHQPCLRYDALEVYFADAVEEWTRNPANRLVRRDGPTVDAGAGLSLELLGPTYADGHPAAPADCIESTRDDYDHQYFALRRSDPNLRNVIYGRAVDGTTGLWLQYWFFYFLNDYQLAWGIDVHEGDWEMIQLRVPPGEERPQDAVYAQHTFCEIRAWEDVRTLAVEKLAEGGSVTPGDEARPLVYVGRGSHASFFEPGYHQTDFYDQVDGLQRAKSPTRLVDVTDPPAWLLWPGHWGGKRTGFDGPASPSQHEQFHRPEALLTTEGTTSHRLPEPPGAPKLTPRQHDGHLALEFDASKCTDPPAKIIVTVNCSDDKADPPRALRVEVADLLWGQVETRVTLEARKHYDVRIGSVDGEGRPSPAEIFLFDPPNPLRRLVRVISSAAGRAVYAVRRVLGIEEGKRSRAPLA
jgi:hypothetical protein